LDLIKINYYFSFLNDETNENSICKHDQHKHMKHYFVVISLLVLITMIPISFADQKSYDLKADEKTFDVSYSFDGDVIAMTADKESTSILIGTQNVKDSTFVISFPSELLSAQDAEFVVLVDGLETDYAVSYDGDKPTITFPIPADTEEIEIIGTSVVPEFPFGVLTVLGIMTATIIVFSRTRLRPFR